MNFSQKLARAMEVNRSRLCVGLDPDPEKMALPDVAAFNREIVQATRDLVCAYKPNLAFYEALGRQGMAALEETLKAIPGEIPVIGDAKRGDVAHSAQAYARSLFEVWGFDAITVNPYLGHDSVAPFLRYRERGVFLLCRTSNAGAADFQDLPVPYQGRTIPLYQVVALKAREWWQGGDLGLVVGATYPRELAQVRQHCPELPILVPGIGAQGGEIEACLRAGLDAAGGGLVLTASRSVLYASGGRDFAEKAREQALGLRGEINAGLARLARERGG